MGLSFRGFAAYVITPGSDAERLKEREELEAGLGDLALVVFGVAEGDAGGVGEAHLDRAAGTEGRDLLAGGDPLAGLNRRVDTLVDEDHGAPERAVEQLVEDVAFFRPARGAGLEDEGVADRDDRAGAGEVDPL